MLKEAYNAGQHEAYSQVYAKPYSNGAGDLYPKANDAWGFSTWLRKSIKDSVKTMTATHHKTTVMGKRA